MTGAKELYMTNFSPLLNACKEFTEDRKSNNKTPMLNSSELEKIIPVYLDASDIDLLQTDFTKFYNKHTSECNEAGLFQSEFIKAIEDIRPLAKTLNKYSRHAMLPEQPKQDEKLTTGQQYNKDIADFLQHLWNDLTYDPRLLPKELITEVRLFIAYDVDTKQYLELNPKKEECISHSRKSFTDMLTVYIRETQYMLLPKGYTPQQASEHIACKIDSRIKRNEPFTYCKSKLLYDLNKMPQDEPTGIDPVNYLSWDKSIIRIERMIDIIKYVYLSLYIQAHRSDYKGKVQPCVFVYLQGQHGTGKDSFFELITKTFYGSTNYNAEKQLTELTDKNLIELATAGYRVIQASESDINEVNRDKIKRVVTASAILDRLAYGHDLTEVNNLMYFFFSSNRLPQVESTERRFIIIPNFKTAEGKLEEIEQGLNDIKIQVLEDFRKLTTAQQEEYFIKRQRDMIELAQSTALKYGEIAQLSEQLVPLIQGIFDRALDSYHEYHNEREIFINALDISQALRSSCNITDQSKIKSVLQNLGVEYCRNSQGTKRGYKFICAYWKNLRREELETETKKELPQLSSNDIINNVQSVAK